MRNRFPRLAALLPIIGLVGALALFPLPVRGQDKASTVHLEKNDRVAWVGSSSTNIGVWPKTMEFLLRTRHPELQLTFKKFSTGGGTFATGVQNLDKWLDDFKPSVVVLNYGSNDANAGEKGLPQMKENITKCVAKIEATKARVIFSTFQAADVRKSGEAPAARRKLYAAELWTFCHDKKWPIVDVFQPLTLLQQGAQKEDDKYTMLRDSIHLTNPAYIAWGYFLYGGMKLKGGVSELVLTPGVSFHEEGCKLVGGLKGVKVNGGEIRFVRQDLVLPILPPGPLPPRKFVPLESQSPYRLRIGGLKAGMYDIECEGKLLGVASADDLGKGVNINTLILDSGATPPWDDLAKKIWAGKELEQIGKTQWNWRIAPKK